MRRLAEIAALALAIGLAACQPAPLGGGFSVEGPGRLTRALEPDEALCSKLDVELTFDRTDDLAPPPIDAVDLIPQDGDLCTWVLEEEYQLPAGTYDLRVDFEALDEVVDCEILAGLYIRRGLEFPFDDSVQPLTDADFLSTPEDENDPRLQGEAVDFDFDDDGLDNLEELASDANPCKESSIPQVELTVDPDPLEEGIPFDLLVSTSDEDGASHRAVVTISHENGDGYPPETITFVHYTHTTQDSSIDPDPATLPWDQKWDLVVGPDELVESGAGRWTLSFTPQEPFVGSLVIQARVDNGADNLFDQTDPVRVEVSQVNDPPFVVLEGESTPFTGALAFEEQAASPTQHRITIMNLDLGSPASLYTTELAACTPPPDQSFACPEGMQLTRDGPVSILTWSPQNHHVLGPPVIATLELTDTEGVTQDEVQIPLAVSPLYNDPPEIIPPAAQDLALPKLGFEMHRADFVVVDIDEVDLVPVCSVTGYGPAPGTSCDNALKEVSCEVIEGTRDGAYWDALITLVPDEGYISCGTEPAFEVSYRVDDSPPDGAVNASETATRTIRFRTPEVLSVVPMGLTNVDYPNAIFLDGSIKRALVTIKDKTLNDMVFAIVGVDTAPQSENFGLLRTFATTEAEDTGLGSEILYKTGTVDQVNHRVALLDNFLPGGEYGLLVFDLQSMEVAAGLNLTASCDGAFVGGLGDVTNPVVDPQSGDIYYLCDTSPDPRVVRVDGSNTLSHLALSDFNAPFIQNTHAAVVVDPSGNSWLVLMANDGFYLLDLATFDDPAPLTLLLSHPQARDIDHRVVDSERGSLLFTYQLNNTQVYLGRILFQGGSPSLDTPLLMAADGAPALRPIILRRPFSGFKTPPPQLVFSLGFDYYEPPDLVFVDLGDPQEQIPWSEARRESSGDYYINSSSNLLFPCADRRYFLQPATVYSPTGLHLHAYQENMESLSYEAGIPYLDGLQQVVTSHRANLSLMSVMTGTMIGDLIILDFIEAANLMDQ